MKNISNYIFNLFKNKRNCSELNSFTWCIPYSATVDENKGYWGIGTITPAGLEDDVVFNKNRTTWKTEEKNVRRIATIHKEF